MTYYDDLINDKLRVEAFTKAIKQKTHGITYDLGTGSGILAQIASEHAQKVYAIERNPLIIKKTQKNLEKYSNITLLQGNLTDMDLPEKADTIICEMLDTALIDEEQVPVINHIHKYTKEHTKFIPQAVYSTIQLINTNISYITYYEDKHPKITEASEEIKYDYLEFNKYIKEDFEKEIKIKSNEKILINALKITTYTILADDITLAPTPMLNPPILIPVNNIQAEENQEIKIHIKYKMGSGLNTIQATIR